jgi:hypothetical protein
MTVHSDRAESARPEIANEQGRASETKLPKRRTPTTAVSDLERPRMRITGQFRHAGVMVYDLKAGERRIELRVGPSTSAAPSSSWSIVLSVKGSSEPTIVVAAGTTRLLALASLEEQGDTILPKEDWIDIREALTEVRAL